jgi:hypothetical protein
MGRRASIVVEDLEPADRRLRGKRARRVLLVGEFPAGLRLELVERGAIVSEAADTHEAFNALAAADFDAVGVAAFVPGNGEDLLTAVKEPAEDHLHTLATLAAAGSSAFLRGAPAPTPEVLAAARERHRMTPFIMLPKKVGERYAMVVFLPGGVTNCDPAKRPLATVLLTASAAEVLGTSGAMS